MQHLAVWVLAVWALGCCLAQQPTYQSVSLYSVPNCKGVPETFVATKKACSAIACSTFASLSLQTTCSTGQPALPAGSVAVKTYSASGSCQGDPDVITTYPLNTCAVASTTPTYSMVTCSNGVLTIATFNDPLCSKQSGIPQTITTGCVANGATSLITTCTALPCFHEDSLVAYKGGAPLTLRELQAGREPDCVVPHTVRTEGLKIVTSCSAAPLRLTSDHLVFTPSGIVAAKDLKPAQTVYGDEQERKLCSVVSVEPDHQVADYFGLNCRESVVMVSGVKTSTFGSYHTLPSVWMKVVSSVLGVERASRLGDALVSQLRSWNLI